MEQRKVQSVYDSGRPHEKMAEIISEAKKGTFFPFRAEVCKPRRGQLVGEIILKMAPGQLTALTEMFQCPVSLH